MQRFLIALAAVFLLSRPAFAQDKTIDLLNPGAALTGTESIPMFQTANPAVRTSPSAIGTYVLGRFSATLPLSYNNTTGVISITTPLPVSNGGTGATSFTIGLPLLGNGVSPFTVGALSGNTTRFVTQGAGVTTSGHQLVYDASGNAVDGGAPGSGGTVTSLNQGTNLSFSSNPITTTGTISCPNVTTGAGGCVPASGGGTTNFLRADATWAAPPGGGGATSHWTGTVAGTGTYTSTTVQGGFTNTPGAYKDFCGIFASANTAAATLNLDGAGVLPIQVQNANGSTLATTGSEIVPGFQCYQLNSGATAFVRINPVGGHITRMTLAHTVTIAEWNNSETFVCDNISTSCALTLPSAAGPPALSTQGGINVNVTDPNVPLTLTPQAGDGFNNITGGIGVSVFAVGNRSFSVTTTGAAGVNAFQAPIGIASYVDMSWMPGQNLSAANMELRGSFGLHTRLAVGIKCTPSVVAGGTGTATIEFRYAPSGTAISAGTLISAAAAFNAAGTANTEQIVGLAGAASFIVIPAGNRIGAVAAGTNWSTTGTGTGGISAGAGGCTMQII